MTTSISITPQTAGFCSSVSLQNCADVDKFFQLQKKLNYIPWFNQTLADRGPWAGVRLIDNPSNDAGFRLFWDLIDDIFGATINLTQFVSLMSILSNECRANFTPQPEKTGLKEHPGLSYLFDAIKGLKRSYNTLTGGKTAFDCFNSPVFLAAHGKRAGASTLQNTADVRWKGEVWPADVNTSTDPAISGFIMEADFCKFRGRGFIQTTGRANYISLIDFVQRYKGANTTLTEFSRKWQNKSPDALAFESSNDEWDALFGQTGLIVAAQAVRLHNQGSGNYLALSSDPAVLNGTGKGSLFFMGKCIGGGDAYAGTFRDRVSTVLAALQQA